MDERNVCPICKTKGAFQEAYPKGALYSTNCPRCGKFGISYEALSDFDLFDTPINRAIISYWIRSNQNKTIIELTREKIQNIIENTNLPKPSDLLNNLLLWVGDNLNKISDETDVDFRHVVAVVGCIDVDDLDLVVNHLVEKGYIHNSLDYDGNTDTHKLHATMTFDGWDKFYELKTSSLNSKLAFMAMQYDNQILQEIFEKIIKEAVSKTGFEIRKLDDIKKTGLIDDKLRVEIRRSKFIIADLTDENRGAYWEAGYAEGLGQQVIYICEKEKFDKLSTHFDTNHHLTIKWKNDPDSLKKFAEELKATIRATFPAEAKMED